MGKIHIDLSKVEETIAKLEGIAEMVAAALQTLHHAKSSGGPQPDSGGQGTPPPPPGEGGVPK